jgi:hypothetical protein
MRVDATVAYLSQKEAFRRTVGVTSFFGILIAIGALAHELRRIAAPALSRARPRRPSFASTMIAIAVLREPLRSIGGDPARNTPYAGTTIALGLPSAGGPPHRSCGRSYSGRRYAKSGVPYVVCSSASSP